MAATWWSVFVRAASGRSSMTRTIWWRHLFAYLLACLLTYLFTYLFAFIYLHNYSHNSLQFFYVFTYFHTFLLTYWLTYLLIYLFIYIFIYIFTHLFTYLFIYLRIYIFSYFALRGIPPFGKEILLPYRPSKVVIWGSPVAMHIFSGISEQRIQTWIQTKYMTYDATVQLWSKVTAKCNTERYTGVGTCASASCGFIGVTGKLQCTENIANLTH